MKSIAEAKQRYTLSTGNYTGDDDLLDIKIPYISKTCDEKNCLYGFRNGFLCIVRNYSTSLTLLCNNRKGIIEGGYTIDYYYPSQSLCYGKTGSAGEKACKSLGKKRPSCSDGNTCYDFL
ncbi:MAG: hypothetical protein LBG46_05535 [Elusimicrobiota bacterium]|nr:hypothetical protein [Elusimicrobiota bacterium]